MKRFLVVFILALVVCSTSFAAYQDKDGRIAEKYFSDAQFDVLYSTTATTLDATAAVNFQGILAATATGTTPIAIPTTRPFLIKVQNLTSNHVLKSIHSSDATSTVYPTAANACALVGVTGAPAISDLEWRQVFYDTPTIQLGAATTTAVLIEIYTRSKN